MTKSRSQAAPRGEHATRGRCGLAAIKRVLADSHDLLTRRVEALRRRAERAKGPAQIALVSRELSDLERTQEALSRARAHISYDPQKAARVKARAAEVARGR